MEYERKAEPIGRELVRRLLPRRDPEGHKGTFGKVLCLCGSVGYTGAPVFASRGAVRSGAGLVFLGVPESIWPVAAVCCWGAFTHFTGGCPVCCWQRPAVGKTCP